MHRLFRVLGKKSRVCRYKDGVEEVLRSIVHADLMVFASPLIMGRYSALLKRFHDPMLPILHPFFELVNGECHRRKRYASYLKLALLYSEGDASPEEIENIRFTLQRISLNVYSDPLFCASVHQKKKPKILCHETYDS